MQSKSIFVKYTMCSGSDKALVWNSLHCLPITCDVDIRDSSVIDLTIHVFDGGIASGSGIASGIAVGRR